MRSWILITCLLASMSCVAQSVRPTLEIGSVTVSLGMLRQDVVNECASAGFKQMSETKDAKKDEILFQNGSHLYLTQFQANHLIYADREWYSKESDLDAFQTTLLALGTFSDENKRLAQECSVGHFSLNDPDSQMNKVAISCGQKSFVLIETKAKGKSYYGVLEQIGSAVH